MAHSCVVMVFTRTPVAGKVKTRLIPALGEEGAADLYRELQERTLATVVEADIGDVQVHCWPEIDHPWLRAMQNDYPVRLIQQRGTELGGRMHRAFADALVHYKTAILVGCDIPELSEDDLGLAREKLAENEVVLGPAEDGGYYLVGLNRPCPALFEDIPWGGDKVLAKTRDRIRQQGLHCFELPVRWDVDWPRDVARYRELTGEKADE